MLQTPSLNPFLNSIILTLQTLESGELLKSNNH